MTPSRPSRRKQTLASLAILALLAAIAAGVYLRQFQYDRSIYAPPLTGGTAASGPGGVDLARVAEGLLVPAGPAEGFDAENLWIKINGKAEGYLPFGVVRLDCRRLALAGRPGESLEVFLYEMKDAQGALSVFTRQRRADAKPLAGLGPDAYRSGSGIFLAHGRFYAEILAAADTPALATAGEELARRLVAALPSPGTTPAGLSGQHLFPPENLKAGSIAPMPAEQTGFDKLGNLLTAVYVVDGKQAVAFVSLQASPQRAAELADEYVKLLAGQGWRDEGAKGGKMMSLAGTYRVVFAAGNAVAGVHECEDQTVTTKVAAAMKTHMEPKSTTRAAETPK